MISGGPARTLRALVFALVPVGLVAGVRADSDGRRPGLAVLLLAVTLVTALVRPLTARRRRPVTLLAALLATEVAVHAALLAVSTGRAAHPGPVGWVCCPPTATASTAWYDGVTARAGLVLLGLQLVVAVLAALWLAGLEGLAWELALLAVTRAAAAAGRALVVVLARCFAGLAGLAPSGPPRPSTTAEDDLPRPVPAVLVRVAPRRGPPSLRTTPRPPSAPARRPLLPVPA